MKKIFSIVLAFILVLGICGCDTQPDNSSSDVVIIETEEVIVDQNGNTLTSSQDTVVSSIKSENEDITSNVSSTPQKVEIDYNTTVEVDICGDIIRGYLDATDAANQYYWLSTYTNSSSRYDHQHIPLDWPIDMSAKYTVYFSENADFSNAITVITDASKDLKAATLIPGKEYYWKVMGEISNEALSGGKIKIVDAPVRFIYIDGIRNVRDMGGWKTESGKTVKYGMLYRGGQLNTEKDGSVVNAVKEEGLKSFNKLGIKTEFDLRSIENVHVQTSGTNLNYVLFSGEKNAYAGYTGIFTKNQKDKYVMMFKYLSDISNYPIYSHCQGGADRTGTYAFLLNGLLGVSYEDLIRDFELTSFCGLKRWRSEGSGNTFSKTDADMKDGNVTVSWRAMYDGMMDYGSKNGCTTLQQSIEHWLINYVGVPNSQIDSFKSIMLE